MSTDAETYVLGVASGTSVELANIKIQGTKRGIMIGANGENSQNISLKLENAEIEATDRAIGVMSDSIENLTIDVIDSTISHGGFTDYNTEYDSKDTRGIAMWTSSNSTVTIDNSTVQGFAYPLNIAGDSAEGLVFNVDNSAIKGRCAVNSWCSGATYNFDGCELVSINNQSGSSEGFAAIVLNTTAADNTVNVNNCNITGSFNGAGVDNPNATAFITTVRSSGDKITITGDTTYTCLPDKGGLDGMMFANAPDFKIDQDVYNNMFTEWIDGKHTATLSSDGMYALS